MNVYKTISIGVFAAVLSAFFLSSCVSVKLGDSTTQKSSRYSFTAPNSNFRSIKDKTVDVAWIQKNTGSTLSVRTKCEKGLDLDLSSWILERSESLGNPGAEVKIDKIEYNAREAVQTIFSSEIEGFQNKVAMTTFIKNSCHYIIALTSLSTNFDKDLPEYQKFLQGFKAW